MYESGRGVLQNWAEAATWFRNAADQGLADAQYDLGRLYADGRGVILPNCSKSPPDMPHANGF
jgi:TPR repeat protein